MPTWCTPRREGRPPGSRRRLLREVEGAVGRARSGNAGPSAPTRSGIWALLLLRPRGSEQTGSQLDIVLPGVFVPCRVADRRLDPGAPTRRRAARRPRPCPGTARRAAPAPGRPGARARRRRRRDPRARRFRAGVTRRRGRGAREARRVASAPRAGRREGEACRRAQQEQGGRQVVKNSRLDLIEAHREPGAEQTQGDRRKQAPDLEKHKRARFDRKCSSGASGSRPPPGRTPSTRSCGRAPRRKPCCPLRAARCPPSTRRAPATRCSAASAATRRASSDREPCSRFAVCLLALQPAGRARVVRTRSVLHVGNDAFLSPGAIRRLQRLRPRLQRPGRAGAGARRQRAPARSRRATWSRSSAACGRRRVVSKRGPGGGYTLAR